MSMACNQPESFFRVFCSTAKGEKRAHYEKRFRNNTKSGCTYYH